MRLLPTVLLVILCACAASSGVYHEVRKGQTLYRISRTYGVDQGELMRVNGISDPTQLQQGARLYIPGATRVLPVERTSGGGDVPPEKPRKERIQRSHVRRPVPIRHRASPATVSTPAVSLKHSLAWPVKGDIIRHFSGKKGGSSGVEIAVAAGTVVRAAAAGRVIYSDDGIRGFGHLLILQHEHGLFTIYGFNKSNLVQAGSYVSRGQKIALSGVPPSGGAARLHFEVRQGKTPVDPTLYLP